MSGSQVGPIYRRWFRDRLKSTIFWTLGLGGTIALTAAFYPALESSFADLGSQDGGVASIMGLSGGIDPSTPLGFLWSNLYANIVPWILMALAIALGTAAIAGDEESGTLEYLLSKPVTRTQVVVARFAAMVTILAVAAVVSGVLLMLVAPFVDLTGARTTTTGGTSVTSPGLGVGNVAAGTLAAFAVGLGSGGVAFVVGAATGRKSLAMGVSTGLAVGGYLLYTLANVTNDLKVLTWLSPWRWYVDDAMLIDGLTWNVCLPFVLAAVCLVASVRLFARRDLQS